MPKQTTTSRKHPAEIEPDVLIIGGGVQGLWLLNDLRRHKCSALLLERRELGGEQTCHSHVYIHEGHLYREVRLAERLHGVAKLWHNWPLTHPVKPAFTPSYFGFQNSADADMRKSFWSDPRLKLKFGDYVGRALPAALKKGAIRVVLESPEMCLDGESLIGELRRNVDDSISQIASVTKIEANDSGNAIDKVEVVAACGSPLVFRPRAVVLTAGSGNQALLDLASGGRRPLQQRTHDAQQIRKAHMLVVKGERQHLPPLTGVFDPYGLFIVSRELEKKVVWLVSDGRSEPLSNIEDWTVFDERWWLAAIWESLQELSPRCFKHPSRLEWGVYAAPKSEGRAIGSIPHEERIEQFHFANLWAIWPTKLTLAPKASGEVLQQISKLIPTPTLKYPGQHTWRAYRKSPGVAPERWRKTPLMKWAEFCKCYNL